MSQIIEHGYTHFVMEHSTERLINGFSNEDAAQPSHEQKITYRVEIPAVQMTDVTLEQFVPVVW